jgi:hypothetical protein
VRHVGNRISILVDYRKCAAENFRRAPVHRERLPAGACIRRIGDLPRERDLLRERALIELRQQEGTPSPSGLRADTYPGGKTVI